MTNTKHPLITALAAEYAREIKALKEEQEAQIEQLYCDFRQKYQCLKRTIEAQEGNADRLDTSSVTSINRLSY